MMNCIEAIFPRGCVNGTSHDQTDPQGGQASQKTNSQGYASQQFAPGHGHLCCRIRGILHALGPGCTPTIVRAYFLRAMKNKNGSEAQTQNKRHDCAVDNTV